MRTISWVINVAVVMSLISDCGIFFFFVFVFCFSPPRYLISAKWGTDWQTRSRHTGWAYRKRARLHFFAYIGFAAPSRTLASEAKRIRNVGPAIGIIA